MADQPVVHIGSRKSELAMVQSRLVQGILKESNPGLDVDILTSTTLGDEVLDKPLAVLSGSNPGLFTKDLEVGLLSGAYDLAVHSLKDMPTLLPDGLVLSAISARAPVCDALVVHPKHKGCGGLAGLPDGALIGTSSVRREALLKRFNPTFRVSSVRGNVQTRLQKLRDDANGYDAIILAEAGLRRLGYDDCIEQVLAADQFPYGVGQGALGIETRAGDDKIAAIVASVQHEETALVCAAERQLLRSLGGGCQIALGVNAIVSSPAEAKEAASGAGKALTLHATVLSLDGCTVIAHSETGPLTSAVDIGSALAKQLIADGADVLLGSGPARPLTYGSAEEARKMADDGDAEATPAAAAAASADE